VAERLIEPGELALDTFAGRVGEAFSVRGVPGSGEPVVLALAEAVAVGEAAATGARVPFSLLFTGPAENILPQGIYRVEHEALGATEIFIVPLAPAGDGARYQAVFA
jgi:hypothetical protein